MQQRCRIRHRRVACFACFVRVVVHHPRCSLCVVLVQYVLAETSLFVLTLQCLHRPLRMLNEVTHHAICSAASTALPFAWPMAGLATKLLAATTLIACAVACLAVAPPPCRFATNFSSRQLLSDATTQARFLAATVHWEGNYPYSGRDPVVVWSTNVRGVRLWEGR